MTRVEANMSSKEKCRQAGLVTVEFALIGAVFFLVLFGIIEMGRFLFTWNVLDEVTRRAARLAAVCPMAQVDKVRQAAVFNSTILSGLTPENVNVQYLDRVFTPTATLEQVLYVRTNIQNFQYQLLIPFLPLDPFDASSFTTTLPSESLGITPAGAWTVQCTGA